MALNMTLLDLVNAVSGYAGRAAELIGTVVYMVKLGTGPARQFEGSPLRPPQARRLRGMRT